MAVLTTREAASVLGVGREHVVILMDRGDMPCTRTPGGQRRIDAEDLKAWATTHGGYGFDGQVLDSLIAQIDSSIAEGPYIPKWRESWERFVDTGDVRELRYALRALRKFYQGKDLLEHIYCHCPAAMHDALVEHGLIRRGHRHALPPMTCGITLDGLAMLAHRIEKG